MHVNGNARQLVNKWSAVPGAMGIGNVKDPYIRENLAVLLDNQEQLIKEGFSNSLGSTNMGGSGPQSANYNQSDAPHDSGVFAPMGLALVRRAFPNLFAHDIVGVQAMSGPVSLAYALRFMYDGPTDGDGNEIEAAWNDVPEFAGFSAGKDRASAAASLPTKPVIGDFADDADLEAPGAQTAAQKLAAALVTWNAEVAAAKAAAIDNPSNPNISAADMTDAEAWAFSGNEASFGSNPSGTQSKLRELKLKWTRAPIVAKTRKLASSFSLEAAQDIFKVHALDIKREMLNVLQYELAAEQDREILARCRAAAHRAADYAFVDNNALPQRGRHLQELIASLITKIIFEANQLGTRNRRGTANIVVVNNRIATLLQSAGPQFQRVNSNVNASTTIPLVGTLNGNIKVYRDSYLVDDEVLLAYKGSGISDAGIIYAPYITGLALDAQDSDTFGQRVGVFSRYDIVSNLLGTENYYTRFKVTEIIDLVG